MKYFFPFLFFSFILSSCMTSSKAYKLNKHEKDSQKGYHAKEAEQIIDKNKKNKKSNQKAADKNRQKTTEELSKLNSESANKFKKPKKHHGVFKYYWY
jgi:hypothetical protein